MNDIKSYEEYGHRSRLRYRSTKASCLVVWQKIGSFTAKSIVEFVVYTFSAFSVIFFS